MSTRRDFITKSLVTVGATVLGANSVQALTNEDLFNKISVRDNDIILFQGDSITDSGRDKNNLNPNQTGAFGNGYAQIAASHLLNKFAKNNIKVYNRGISGNRVPDLLNRWQTDTLDLKPTILSILIGVNDFWRTMDSNAQNTPAAFKSQYQKLLDETLKNLPDVKLIIGEPFGLKDVKHVTGTWYPAFPAYQEVTREIAKEYKARFIPYQNIFNGSLKRAAGDYWTTDGIHTSLAGSNLMAESILNAFKMPNE
ncbi:SGNH/GDSL hydrolase family protein [Sphingobacterium hungaricum]|uniref:Lysophospholipase n=1 Tax=Sphingobacterium hungaricum TaxID=2082723 RepID=A0A928YQB0_9SPHI|nr:SGNH/GDSL hydrolase family protein [Sphingobacterium hungaricum]MBE8712845.1 lysophospholipase [Sphingobacterium hungaricum]